jgi:hypothetical protein
VKAEVGRKEGLEWWKGSVGKRKKPSWIGGRGGWGCGTWSSEDGGIAENDPDLTRLGRLLTRLSVPFLRCQLLLRVTVLLLNLVVSLTFLSYSYVSSSILFFKKISYILL